MAEYDLRGVIPKDFYYMSKPGWLQNVSLSEIFIPEKTLLKPFSIFFLHLNYFECSYVSVAFYLIFYKLQ